MTPPAVRKRRSRAHLKGEHDSSCAPDCDALAAKPAAVTPVEAPKRPRKASGQAVTPSPAAEPVAERKPGGIEAMARAFVDTLPFAAGDPRRMIGELAVALGRKMDEDGAAPPAVRELRTLIMQITEVPNQPAGVVDELRLQRAQRRFDAILANVEKGMPLAFDSAV